MRNGYQGAKRKAGRLAELKALKAAKDRTEAEAKAKILKNNKVTEDEMAKNTKAPNPQ
jgi:hypothetical protein